MYKYANFGQNIPCGFRVMRIFTEIPLQIEIKLGKASPLFAYQWLDNVKLNKYAKFDSNIPCGSRVRSIFTNRPQTGRLTHGWTQIVIIMQTQGSCKSIVQTKGSGKTHVVIIVQTQGSCNIMQTNDFIGLCNILQTQEHTM